MGQVGASNVIGFPEMNSAVVHGRLRLAKIMAREWVRERLGRGMEIVHAPAQLRHFEFVDPATDETLYLYTDAAYSVLCVGSRRFYFDRVSGKYDGQLASVLDVRRRIELTD